MATTIKPSQIQPNIPSNSLCNTDDVISHIRKLSVRRWRLCS